MGLLGSLGRGVQGLLGGVGQAAGTLMSPLYRDIEDPVARQQALLALSAGLQNGDGIGAAGLMGRQAGQGYLDRLRAQQDEEMARQFRKTQMDAFRGKQEQEGQDRNAQAQILGQLTGRSAESFQATDPLMVQSQARRMMPGELSPGFEGSPGVGRQAALGTALANPGAVQGNPLLQNLLGMDADGGPKIGSYNPGDYTPRSFSKFLQSRNPADLERQYAPPQPMYQFFQDGSGNFATGNSRTGQIAPTNTKAPPKSDNATEGERTSANYFGRMQAAEQILGNYMPTTKDYTAAINVMSRGPIGSSIANSALSAEGQQYYQAAADWVRAKLRKESGAVISPQEMEQEIKTYFPLPGDEARTIEQKRRARLQAMSGMQEMGGRAVTNYLDRTTPTQGMPSAGDIDAELQRRAGRR